MKKAFIQKLSIAMASALVITAAAPATADAAAKDMKINKTSKTLYLNEDNLTNTASVYDFSISKKPADYKSKYKFTWYEDSANGKSYVDVAAGGVVTAKKVGQTTIKCDIIKKSTGKLYKTVEATVTVKANAETVTIKNAPTEAMTVGTTFDFNRTLKAANGGSATDKTEWVVTADAEGKETTDVASIDKNGVATALKAGTFYVFAKTYQSAATKAQGYTAVSEPVKVDVALNLTDITLKNPNTVELSFDSSVKDVVKNTSDVVIETVAANRVKFTVKSVNVSEDGKTATVETFQEFTNDTTYKVSAADSSKEFKAQIGTINSIVLEDMTVPVYDPQNEKTISYKVLDQYGVDVTKKYGIGAELTLSSTYSNGSAVDPKGVIKMIHEGDQVSVQVSYSKYDVTTGNMETIKSNVATITCGKDAIASTSKWTIADVNADVTKVYDKIDNTIAVNDVNKKLFVTLKNNFGADITTGITFESMNSDILAVNNDGELFARKVGSAVIKVTSGQYVDYLTVNVKAEAGLKAIKADVQSYALSNSTNLTKVDSKDVTFTLVDSYDNAFNKNVNGTTATVTELQANKALATVATAVSFNAEGKGTLTFTANKGTTTGTGIYKVSYKDATGKEVSTIITISVVAPSGASTFRIDLSDNDVDNHGTSDNTIDVSLFTTDAAGVLVSECFNTNNNISYAVKTAAGVEKVASTKVAAGANTFTIDAKALALPAGSYVLEVTNGPVVKTANFTVRSSKLSSNVVAQKNKVTVVNASVNESLTGAFDFYVDGKKVTPDTATFTYFAIDKELVSNFDTVGVNTVSGGTITFANGKTSCQVLVTAVTFTVGTETYTVDLGAGAQVTIAQ